MSSIYIIPGVLDSAENFKGAIALVEGHKVVALERPGMGSRVNDHPLPTIQDSTDWILDQIPDDGPVVLVGHSHGCLLATSVAMQAPERVSVLGLYEPLIYWDEEVLPKWSLPNDAIMAMAAHLIVHEVDDGCRALADWLMGPGAWDAIGPESRAVFVSQKAGLYADLCAVAFFSSFPAFNPQDVTHRTLVSSAVDSPPGLQETSQAWLVAVPDSEWHPVESGKHLSHIFNPQGFADFLTAVGDQGDKALA